jgi:hypothetical protein
MKNVFLILFLAASFQSCMDHEARLVYDKSNYLPLEVGNYWEFTNKMSGGAALATITRTVTGKTNLEGKEYFVVVTSDSNSYSDTAYYRKDDQQYVYVMHRRSGEENTFRLLASDGTSWSYPTENQSAYNVNVAIATLQINDLSVDSCKTFSYDVPQWADEEHFVTLAPGVGFIKEGSYAWGITSTLRKARISGVEISF